MQFRKVNSMHIKKISLSVILSLMFFITGAQEGPRLLFSKDDVAGMRNKLSEEPYKSMYEKLLQKAAVDPSENPGSYNYNFAYHAIDNAFLYTLTGEPQYATKAYESVSFLVSQEEWADDSFRALSRAMHAKGVSLAYDMCKNAWSAPVDSFVSEKLVEMGASLYRFGGQGWPSGPGNNWRAVRYGASGLCYLSADYISDSSRESEVARSADMVLSYFNANLSSEPGGNGWNPEGIGYVIYPAGFWAVFNAALQLHYPEMNFLNRHPHVKNTLTTIYRGSTLINSMGYHPDFSDDNPMLGGEGVHGLAFKNTDPELIPAMKWNYDRYVGLLGDKSFDSERGGLMFSYLYYPADLASRNPEYVFDLNYVDEDHGMLIFRNRFSDYDDIIAQHNAKGRAPTHCHAGADANGFRILGLGGFFATGAGRQGLKGSPGQTTVFMTDPNFAPRSDKTGNLIDYDFQGRGSGYSVIEGSSTLLPYHRRTFVADFEKESGYSAVFIVNDSTHYGQYWRINTPEFNTVAMDHSDSVFVITAPNGNYLFCKILKGDPQTLRSSHYERGSGIIWDGSMFNNNNWVDFKSDSEEFLVLMVMGRSYFPYPEVKNIRSGNTDYIFIGERVFRIKGREVEFLTLKDWEEIKLNDESFAHDDKSAFKVFSNPRANEIEVKINLKKSRSLSVDIFDLQGKHIKNLKNGFQPAGENSLKWVYGNRKGFYIIKYSSGNRCYSESLVL